MPSTDPDTATVDSKSSRSSDKTPSLPISKSASNTSLVPSATSSSSLSSSPFGSRWHHHKNKASHDSAISHAILGPAISSIAAHNPFSIGHLTEDGKEHRQGIHHSKVPSGDYDYEGKKSLEDGSIVGGGEANDEHASLQKKERRRKRDLFKRAAGRSLSPFRYHHGEKRSGRKASLSGESSSRLNTRDSIDVERERGREQGGDGATTDGESDGESIRSGITPRNNAFGGGESDDEDLASINEIQDQSGATAADIRARNQERHTHEDAEDEKGEREGDETEEEDEDDLIYFDDETLDNTLFNAGCIGLHDAWQKDDNHSSKGPEVYYGPDDYDAAWGGAGPTGHDEGDEGLRAPNVVIGEQYGHSLDEFEGDGLNVLQKEEDKPGKINRPPSATSSEMSPEASNNKSTYEQWKWAHQDEKQSVSPSQKLSASRPIFERNRCTITLVHGEYERWAKESKRPKRYIVASDGSEESSYAIEWTIGTVLRDGDEMLVVSVMETDTKLDSTDPHHEDRAARREHQMIRQSMCVVLARRATAVLQRTRLGVKVSCQALHARNSRHMFIDMIDFFEPTMCVVGSRGLGSLKGVLLGSFSHYCVQKSPVPVMVARKRLKLPALPRGKGDVVSNVRARHMRLDQAMIEKDANVAEEDPEGKDKKDDAGEESEKKQDAADAAAAEEEEGDAKEGTDKREAGIGQEEKEDQAVRDKDTVGTTSAEGNDDKTDKQGEEDQDEEGRGRRRAGEHEKVQMEEEEPRGRSRSRVAEGQ